MNQDRCTRSDEERCTVGTWIVDKVRKVVEFGYFVKDVFEVWEYNVTCLDKGSKSGCFFTEYVVMFLKLKEESSGYPSRGQS
jgi:hypothetical protein